MCLRAFLYVFLNAYNTQENAYTIHIYIYIITEFHIYFGGINLKVMKDYILFDNCGKYMQKAFYYTGFMKFLKM